MSETPNLALPHILPSQAQKHVTHNEALEILDATVQLAVSDRDLSAPPVSPAEGGRYIVAVGATGAWAGKDDQIAVRRDGGWIFHAPRTGWLAWVIDESQSLYWSGSAWEAVTGAIAALQNMDLLGINTVADATNRLAAKSDAVLLSHDDVTPGTGDMQIMVNKAAGGNDAGLAFQTAYSTRALFGLLADDNFTIKTSPDGSAFATVAIFDKTTARASFPRGVQPQSWPMKSLLGAGGARIAPMGRVSNINSAVAANTLFMMPVMVPFDFTATAISVRVTGISAGNVRMGIYADNNGIPGPLVLDAGTISTSAASLREIAISQPLHAGAYWLAAVFDATPTVNCQAATVGCEMGALATNAASSGITGYTRAFTYAALPADESASVYTATAATSVPCILVG